MTPLASLAPISLTDLVAESALLTRVDRKYLLARHDLDDALLHLPTGTRVLEIDGRRSQRYASTYFDTGDRASYRSTATARRRRWKVRTRSYLDTGTCWLEVKTRGPRGTTVKARQPHPVGMPSALTAEATGFVQRTLAGCGVPVPRTGWSGAPALDTAYRRTTLALPDGARATVDTALRWVAPDGTVLAPEGVVIVETKGGSTPSGLDRRLWAAGHRPVRISKFGTGLALLDPTLPAHRWHRLLTTAGPLAG
ncbi:polyphosphate polymerase domain-containing protein [Serinicoccus kebangsaanensis]|uniref:polyphosphate polymerase domain-containing protein n=1 Tax=Serinicoccus kebangsaanensis TaxID=2602069 RepID=UPI00124EAEE3|nr:polyphosphate polymerase domain-containing protein [Serinicoccus kebangsaanensis]